nr:hypothetical protein [Streptomyces sp. Wb2n-11]
MALLQLQRLRDHLVLDSNIGAVAAQVPVQAGEIGQNTCAHDYIDQVMAWAGPPPTSPGTTAWTWNLGVCSGGSVLIEDWNGTDQHLR